MFNSNIIDVAIGLVFVFLTLSLICSAANEGIESFLKRRAKNLERGIRELLGDLSPDEAQTWSAAPPAAGQPAAGTADATKGSNVPARDFVEQLYNHGLINSLYRGKYGETPLGKLPSYIPSTNFALAVLDLRRTVQNLPKNLQNALDAFEMKAKGDLNMLQQELEGWYDSAMDRVSGWYKRRTQMIVVVLGLASAIAVNADSIYIARRLSTDSNLRQSVAKMAEETTKNQGQNSSSQAGSANPGNQANSGSAPSQAAPAQAGSSMTESEAVGQIRANLQKLDGVGLPIGWQEFADEFEKKRAAQGKTLEGLEFDFDFGVEAARMHGIGWIITALAVSLGAPFWFDMLNKIMVVRATVKPSEKSGDERSKDPTPPPQKGDNPSGDGQ